MKHSRSLGAFCAAVLIAFVPTGCKPTVSSNQVRPTGGAPAEPAGKNFRNLDGDNSTATPGAPKPEDPAKTGALPR
ncbi:MAG: hypothetical protein JNL80_07955 [Phycisphaerae bacterium]|jgi:hypothetical protein|nr:hypothetical protein [Phycisphaerae bacterium]